MIASILSPDNLCHCNYDQGYQEKPKGDDDNGCPQFLGLSWLKVSWAFPLHSLKTDLGTIFSARAIPSGTKIRSSKYPKRGMKSGIKSIGLKAYPTTQAANTLAGQGTLGSL